MDTQSSEPAGAEPQQAAAARSKPEPVAAWWHTAVLLLILSYFSFRSLLSPHPVAPVDASIADTHASQIGKYLFIIATEIGTAAWVWAGAQWKGGSFRRLIGGRWDNWRAVAGDIAVALAYWVVWEGVAQLAHWAVDPLHAARAPYQVPSGFAEVSLWIVVSLAAGFNEELTYRGYFQQQFHSLTGNLAAGIFLQGAFFGLCHSYQGWGQVFVIGMLGILDGIFVWWRGNLRAGMISHAWADIFEGYLRFFVFRG